ncbi:MAG: exodeoxyribonuclease VII small subunit [Rickettsiales bacterium]|nr:exodeoxyribonuclease VII small subunit [Pseudomonadota bacterium]MDA0965409.1 exodeoxyribonuclease VII small subunit [Pseudomonadota bacterium]MDG4542734.1 exodeoxyribonuclease VII small subunit [Rickettsiales bacterium]MDG4544818.1 exodeoxyribonuclease VII small subunit [Rickettsiales bacterium]MDG4546940.1 exodeoxyribonuclease VII small subunit [Rickettsiales bacterium]
MSIKASDIKKMDFETAATELEKIVDNFESGNISLEKSIEQYATAAQLKAQCDKKLSEAKLKVEKVTSSDSDSIKTSSFDIG